MQHDQPTVMNIKQIASVLPHDYPFLFVDRIVHLDLENSFIIGQKSVTYNEPFFTGHFPGDPIMPGVLILEALAQTGGVLIDQKGIKDRTALLMTVNDAKFRRPVVPGDLLFLHVQGLHISKRGGKISAQAVVKDQVVAEASIGFGMMDKEQIGN